MTLISKGTFWCQLNYFLYLQTLKSTVSRKLSLVSLYKHELMHLNKCCHFNGTGHNQHATECNTSCIHCRHFNKVLHFKNGLRTME